VGENSLWNQLDNNRQQRFGKLIGPEAAKGGLDIGNKKL